MEHLFLSSLEMVPLKYPPGVGLAFITEAAAGASQNHEPIRDQVDPNFNGQYGQPNASPIPYPKTTVYYDTDGNPIGTSKQY
jgi:hypothetical protein